METVSPLRGGPEHTEVEVEFCESEDISAGVFNGEVDLLMFVAVRVHGESLYILKNKSKYLVWFWKYQSIPPGRRGCICRMDCVLVMVPRYAMRPCRGPPWVSHRGQHPEEGRRLCQKTPREAGEPVLGPNLCQCVGDQLSPWSCPGGRAVGSHCFRQVWPKSWWVFFL